MFNMSQPVQPIRIAHVALQLATGGMEKLLVEFARHADRQRFEPLFITLGEKGQIAQELEACGCQVVALDEPPGLRPALVLRLARLFAGLGPDIVHTHNTKPLLYAGGAARLARVGGVVHTNHGQYFGSTHSQRTLFKIAARCADRIVCVSADSRDLSMRQGLPAAAGGTIQNGIDVSRFAFKGTHPGAPAVVVARLSPEKDIPTLLRAVRLVVEQEPGFRLRIAGDGACFDELKQLARQLELCAHIEFLGEVRDVPKLLGGASMCVLASVTEGISLTILEAMASGLPMVATRVGGTPEVVVDGVTGILVPPGDPAALAGGLLRIWRDPELGARLGEAGRRRVESYFDVRRMVTEYQLLYLDVLRRRGALAAA